MPEYGATLAGSSVAIRYSHAEVLDFLNFLFHDVHCPITGACEAVLNISQADTPGQYRLIVGKEELGRDNLGVKFAAIIFDWVIFNLLNTNSRGVAFHAGAVALQEKVILLPGKSGSGKSTMVAWLAAQGFSYLTDELVFIPDTEPDKLIPFTRPVCIKAGSAAEVKKYIRADHPDAILEDNNGIIIAHTLLNPDFFPQQSFPSLILFPVYQNGSSPCLQKVSGAQTCTLLMECDVNARNLADHGFRQIVGIARSIPAYRIIFGSFEGLADTLAELFAELQWILND